MRTGATQQHRGARLRQFREHGEGVARLQQPGIVDRIQATKQGDDVVAAQPVVFGSDHQVPVLRIDARVEDLHDPAAVFAQQARGQRGLPPATDGQPGGVFERACECGPECVVGTT